MTHPAQIPPWPWPREENAVVFPGTNDLWGWPDRTTLAIRCAEQRERFAEWDHERRLARRLRDRILSGESREYPLTIPSVRSWRLSQMFIARAMARLQRELNAKMIERIFAPNALYSAFIAKPLRYDP